MLPNTPTAPPLAKYGCMSHCCSSVGSALTQHTCFHCPKSCSAFWLPGILPCSSSTQHGAWGREDKLGGFRVPVWQTGDLLDSVHLREGDSESWPFTFSSQCRGKAESLLTLDADWPFSCFVMAIDPTLEVSWERLRNLISSVYICVITAGEENSQVTDTYLSSAEGAHLQLTPLERMTHQEMVQTSRLSPSFDPQQILQLLSVKQSCRYFSALSCYWSLASKEVHGKPHWKHSRVISTCSAAVHCEKSLPSGTAAPRTSSTGSLSQSELSDVSKGISSLEEPKVWDQRCPFTSAVPLDTESNDEVCDYSVPCTPWTLRTVTLV